MRVLITGAAGFIGSSLTQLLLDRGCDVVGWDNWDGYYPVEIKRANLETSMEHPRFTMHTLDIRDEKMVDERLRGDQPDVVVHLAARAGVRPSLIAAPLYVDVNVKGTTVLLEGCRRHDVKKFVFASSSSVYGARPAEPFSEEDPADRPISPYAATKRAGEIICATYQQLHDIDISCLRFFTVYGPAQRPEMAIHHFTRCICDGRPITVFGDGSAQRDFTYISDITSGICSAIDHLDGYRIYNLGGGSSVDVSQMIRQIEKSLDRAAIVKYEATEPGDVPNTLADVSRAKSELGYEPSISFAQGVQKFVEWYLPRHETLGEFLKRSDGKVSHAT